MSIGSILSGLTGTHHAAFSARSATSSASEEMQKLFSKLHMDAIASSSATTPTTTAGTAAATSASSTSTSSTSTGGITDIVHSLRHILDGGIAVAKDARSVAKAATSAYAHGGVGALATQVVDKLA
jgi:hypothetical protein